MTAATRFRAIAAIMACAVLVAWALVPAVASAHSGHHHTNGEGELTGIGVQINSPDDLVQFFPAVQWIDSARVDGQTAKFVYAGTGCSSASYAPVMGEMQGNIALVDARQSETNPADQCPQFTFFQKVQSAQQAGAIGFVHIPGEGEEPRSNAGAVMADSPALEDLPCIDGMAGPFPCDGIDLLAFVPQEDFNGAGVSDLWGWTDPDTGGEYVIMGKTNGVAFFWVTNPTAPEYLGELPNTMSSARQRCGAAGTPLSGRHRRLRGPGHRRSGDGRECRLGRRAAVTTPWR